MEKYLISFLLIVSSFSAVSKENYIEIDMPMICTSAEAVSEMLTEYEEVPALRGFTTRETINGFVDNFFTIYVNPKNRSWTMIEKYSEDMYCLVVAGHSMKPAY